MKVVKFKVIKDFPASIWDVGDIFEVSVGSCMAYVVEIGERSEKYDVRDYPHLFQELTD